MTSRPGHSRTAFTLFELVLVLVMVSVLMGVAAPSLRGFLAGSRSRDAANQLLSLTSWARARAIADCTIYRLVIDPQSGAYGLLVQEGEQFVPTGTDFGQTFSLPDGMRLEFTRADHLMVGNWIDFHPSGRTDAATIRLTNTLNELTIIQCPSPAESFRILTNEEASRL
jgi:Tfp pilus assembly protein FimT